MTGSARCLALLLRTGRAAVAAWVVTVVTLVAVTAAKLVAMYPTQAGRDAYAAAYRGVAGTAALQGRGHDLANPGGMLANELAAVALLLLPVMGAQLGVRFTRAVEEAGRLDLLTAGRVGRLAPFAAGATAALVTMLLAGALSTGALLALGYPVAGTIAYGAALAAFGSTYVAVGLVAGQVTRSAQQAYGIGLVVAAGTYLLRAVLDVRQVAVTWTNPQSWLAEVRPYGEHPPAWPWLAFGVTTAVLVAAAALLAARRDLGAGLLAPGPGPAGASARLRGPVALAARLTRGTRLAWLAGAGTFAFGFGFLAPDMQQLTSRTGQAAGAGIDQVLVLFVQLDAVLAACAAVQVVQVLALQERAGRAGWVLSTTASRWRTWLGTAALATAWSLVTLAWAGAGTGLGLWAGLHRASEVRHGLGAALAHAPAVALMAAVAALLAAIGPRVVVAAWALVGWALVVAFLGDLLQLPPALRRLSPLEWTGRVPLEGWDRPAALVLGLVTAAVLAASAVRHRTRDLTAG